MATTPTASTVQTNWLDPNLAKASTGLTGAQTPAATTQSYAPAMVSVTPQSTVAGQVKGLIDADSPLMQTARTSAAQVANSRGLMNSSMAAQAGEQAVINSALPIASADAQTNFAAEMTNAGAKNDAFKFDAANATEMSKFNTTNQLQSSQFAAQQENSLMAQKLDSQFKSAISNADAQNKIIMQQMSDETKAGLANIEMQYKQAISGSESAERIYSKVMQNITDIVNNPDITDAAAKQTAINNQLEMLRSGLGVTEAVSGLELTSLLDFSSLQ